MQLSLKQFLVYKHAGYDQSGIVVKRAKNIRIFNKRKNHNL